MFVGEALEIHSAGRTSNSTSTASLTYCRVDFSHSSDGNSSVRLPELLVGVCDSTIGAYLFAGRTSVAHEFVRLCNTRIANKMIL